jgi:dCMP deaminase
MIIGVTGNYASGKDTVGDILQEMNFFHVSFSDIIRAELARQKMDITRDNLINTGNELREKHGPHILAKMALKSIEEGENYVFTSIRNPSEVALLQEREDFLMVDVTAPDEVRIERIKGRGKAGDPTTLEELKASESRENSSDPNAQQLQKVASMAQVNMPNDSTLEKLKERVESLVEERLYDLQESRPNWDQYFMAIAEQVKRRATCLSSGKGALIVRAKQIISTGYNGTPKGIQHCNQGSCKRCTGRHLGKLKSGEYYSAVCTCSHAEENAIVQAAANGVSTAGSTIYCTFTPCHMCARMIINAGVSEVVAKVMYPDDVGRSLFAEAGVKLRVLK